MIKSNKFNTGEYCAPECKTLEILLERNLMLIPDSGNLGDAGAAGKQGDFVRESDF